MQLIIIDIDVSKLIDTCIFWYNVSKDFSYHQILEGNTYRSYITNAAKRLYNSRYQR